MPIAVPAAGPRPAADDDLQDREQHQQEDQLVDRRVVERHALQMGMTVGDDRGPASADVAC